MKFRLTGLMILFVIGWSTFKARVRLCKDWTSLVCSTLFKSLSRFASWRTLALRSHMQTRPQLQRWEHWLILFRDALPSWSFSSEICRQYREYRTDPSVCESTRMSISFTQEKVEDEGHQQFARALGRTEFCCYYTGSPAPHLCLLLHLMSLSWWLEWKA